MIPISKDPKQTPFNPYLYDDKCVSEICQCGKHRCPPEDFTKAVKFDKPILQHQPHKKCKCKKAKKKCNCKCKQHHQQKQHVYQERHYDPNSIQSTYQVEFQGKYVEHDPLVRVNGHGNHGVFQHGSNAPFVSSTEYNTQFTGKVVQKDYLAKSLTTFQPGPRPPFDGTTTYNASYQGKYVERQGQIPNQILIQRPYVPFDGTTQYNSKYQYVAVEGGDCQSCCDCQSECSSCCDSDADSLDQINTHNHHNKQIVYDQTAPVYPSFNKQKIVHPGSNQGLQKTKPNNDCPIKKLPQLPKKSPAGKSHTKFQASKNIWR